MIREEIHIALTCDSNYLKYAAIAACSLAENTQRQIVIHYLHKPLPEKELRVFDFLSSYSHVKFRHHLLADTFFDSWSAGRWAQAIFYRLILPDLFPELNKMIYIDCDLCVLDDIGKLYDIPMKGKSALGVITHIKPDHLEKLELDLLTYFNAGVLVLDLKRMREKDFTARCKACFEKYTVDLKYMDQDILNIVLKGDCGFLHPRWNIITSTYRNMPHPALQEEQVREALAHPGIVHFTGGHKPWFFFRSFHHPYALSMKKYAWKAGRKKLYFLLRVKELFFSRIAPLRKKVPWDKEVIDKSQLAG